MFQLEAEVVRVECRGASDICHLIANAVHTDDHVSSPTIRHAMAIPREWSAKCCAGVVSEAQPRATRVVNQDGCVRRRVLDERRHRLALVELNLGCVRAFGVERCRPDCLVSGPYRDGSRLRDVCRRYRAMCVIYFPDAAFRLDGASGLPSFAECGTDMVTLRTALFPAASVH